MALWTVMCRIEINKACKRLNLNIKQFFVGIFGIGFFYLWENIKLNKLTSKLYKY